ncbi:MAG: FMN-binding negative transcriptional regulator, partial [Flavobacteriaceae bacterium]|nr:FMN-binding negative transcriptional regulator [Flavobacteriaceae bacterium]
VHLTGNVVRIESDEKLKESLIIMTEFLEQPDNCYVLKSDNPRMEGLLPYIKMFEITITNWEGKFKLSQDKKKSDMNFAKEELAKSNEENIRNFLTELLS